MVTNREIEAVLSEIAVILDLKGDVLGIHVGAAKESGNFPPYGLAQSTAKSPPNLLQATKATTASPTMATTEPAAPK